MNDFGQATEVEGNMKYMIVLNSESNTNVIKFHNPLQLVFIVHETLVAIRIFIHLIHSFRTLLFDVKLFSAYIIIALVIFRADISI